MHCRNLNLPSFPALFALITTHGLLTPGGKGTGHAV
jgi:hypothetical protein